MVRFKWDKITLWSSQTGFPVLILPFCTRFCDSFIGSLIQYAFVQHPHSVPGIGLGTGDPKMSEEEIPSLRGGCGIQRPFLEEVILSRSQDRSNDSQEEAERAECEFQAKGTVCKAVSS